MHYRDNWYLDAWCHLRQDMRSFAVDAIRAAEILEQPAREVAADELDEVLARGYGIFSGRDTQWAHLRFSPVRARWVAPSSGIPSRGRVRPGRHRYLLEVPYSDDRELIMDILKYGPDVEVLQPARLRQRVRQLLGEALQRYGRGARFADLLDVPKRAPAQSAE